MQCGVPGSIKTAAERVGAAMRSPAKDAQAPTIEDAATSLAAAKEAQAPTNLAAGWCVRAGIEMV